MRGARLGLAAAIATSSAACAWLAGIESAEPKPDDGGAIDGGPRADGGPVSEGGPVIDGATCNAEQLLCDGSCVDPLSNASHCGSCTTACDGQNCVAGHCVTEFFLAPDGSDEANGTSPTTAWKTFVHAFKVLEPGSALILLDGTYAPTTSGMALANCLAGKGAYSGASSAMPIVLAAQHPRAATLASDGVEPAIELSSCSYWTVYGLVATTQDKPVPEASASYQPHTVSLSNGAGIEVRGLLVDGNNRYGATNAVNLLALTSSRVLDSEIYDFSGTGLSVGNVSTVEVQRVYANSRGRSDIEGGAVTRDTTQGDQGFYVGVTGGNVVFENVITEGVQYGQNVGIGAATNGGVSSLGSIAIGGQVGLSVYNADTVLLVRDFVALNSAGTGIGLTRTSSASIENVTAFQTGGIYLAVWGSGIVSNVDSVFGSAGITAGSSWLVEYSNSASNGGATDYITLSADGGEADAFSQCTETTPSNIGLGQNECVAYVLPASNMFHAGRDGGPLGANVIYRYEDGSATATKLWESDGGFPCGPIVTGINDSPDSSCQGVGARLNFVAGGCPVP